MPKVVSRGGGEWSAFIRAAQRANKMGTEKYATDFTMRKLLVTLRKRNFNGRRKREDSEPDFTILGGE